MSSSSSSKTEDVADTTTHAGTSWNANDPEQAREAQTQLKIWPLDEHNAALLNQVHPRDYQTSSDPHVRTLDEKFK